MLPCIHVLCKANGVCYIFGNLRGSKIVLDMRFISLYICFIPCSAIANLRDGNETYMLQIDIGSKNIRCIRKVQL